MGCPAFVCAILLLFFVAIPQYSTNENGCVIVMFTCLSYPFISLLRIQFIVLLYCVLF